MDLQEKTWGNGDEIDIYLSHMDKVIALCGEWLTHIDFSNDIKSILKRVQSLTMLSKCPNLKELNLNGVKIGVRDIKLIARKCKNIESLKLFETTSSCSESLISTQLLSKLNLRCLHLNSAILSGNAKFDGTLLKSLSPELIEELSVKNLTLLLESFISVSIKFYSNFVCIIFY